MNRPLMVESLATGATVQMEQWSLDLTISEDDQNYAAPYLGEATLTTFQSVLDLLDIRPLSPKPHPSAAYSDAPLLLTTRWGLRLYAMARTEEASVQLSEFDWQRKPNGATSIPTNPIYRTTMTVVDPDRMIFEKDLEPSFSPPRRGRLSALGA